MTIDYERFTVLKYRKSYLMLIFHKGYDIMTKTVDKLSPGEKGIVKSLGSFGAVRRHIIDMGITPGAVIIMRKTAPMGDPIEINVRGYELSIRKSEAQTITVEVDA